LLHIPCPDARGTIRFVCEASVLKSGKYSFLLVFFITACGLMFSQNTGGEKKPGKDQPWNFVVSGDSRNCGDVVVPAIAAGAQKNHAAFYWHLGDLRAIYAVDEDYQQAVEHRGKIVEKEAYLKDAWDDFIRNQIGPFGSMAVFIGIGN